MSFYNLDEMASIASQTTNNHKIKVDNAVLETNESVNKIILDLQNDSKIQTRRFIIDSKIQTRRFIIATVISVFSLIAAVTAAVAALIPLL